MTNQLLDEPRQDAPQNKTPAAQRAPAFSITALEPRILRSATAIETSTNEQQPVEGAVIDSHDPGASDHVQTGTDKHDTMTGTDGHDWLEGLGGNDELHGGLGDDVLDGGDGNDDLFGSGGDDHLHGGDGPDHLDGGDGYDVADYWDSHSGVTINLESGKGSGGDAAGEKLVDIEGVVGSAHADTLVGDKHDNQLFGAGGDDHLTGGGGDDYLVGGDGDDTAHFSGKSTDYEFTQHPDGHFTIHDLRGIDGTDTVDTVEHFHFADGTFTADHFANHAPTDLSLIGTTVPENATEGTLVGHMAVKDVDAHDSHHFSLLDDAGGRFTIDEATGEIHVAHGADLNYESSTSHTVDVQVTDSGGATYHEKFSIGVTNVNEIPTDLLLSSRSVNENAAAGTVVGTITAKDPDAGDKFSYSLTDNAGGRFTIDAASGQIKVAKGADLNFEHDVDHDVTVQVKDAGGLAYAEKFTIDVKNVNETPTDLVMTGGKVKENSAAGTVVGKVMGTDPDVGDTLTYSLTNSAGGKFAINSTTGEVTVAKGAKLDFESAANQNITVRVKDAGGSYYDESFKIGVENVNENPTDLTLKGNTINENAAKGAVVGQVSVKDVDKGDVHTYALTNDAGGRFTIDAKTGQIRVADGSKLDYESATNHSVTVRVTDSGGLSYDEAFKLNVKNVNEAPTDMSLSASTVNENAAAGTVVGTITTKDPDKGETFSYSLTNNADGRFTIDAKSGQIKVATGADLDYEKDVDHNVTVQVKDSAGNTYAEKFTIGVKNVNEAPTDMSLSASTVNENAAAGTVVGTIATKDPDKGETFSYSLSDNAGGRFTIDADSGQIKVSNGAELDYESAAAHDVTVQVKDSAGNAYTEKFTIGVKNVNEAPTDLTMTGGTVKENSAAGTVVGKVTGADPDLGDKLTYSLTNNAGGKFAINATTGEVTVAKGATLDVETATSQNITVRVKDAGGKYYDESFAIGVEDVNEKPTDLTLTGDSVNENASTGTVVGQLAVKDVDKGDLHTYSLVNDAGGRFAIDANTGELRVADGSKLDYETATNHSVTVRVTDSGGLSYDEAFKLNVKNVNEAPNDMTLSASSVNENAAAGTVVGTITTKDPDKGETFNYSLRDDAGGRFTIDAKSGQIKVAAGADLDYEKVAAHDVTVQVKDLGGNAYTEKFSIGVKNVNETPTDLTMTGGTVKENSAAGTVVGKVTGADPDLGDKLTYSLTNSAGGKFAINSTTGEVTVAKGATLDFESTASQNITVRVKDAGGKYYDESFAIGVENVNEKPTDLTLSGNTVSENSASGTVVGQVAAKDPDGGDTHTYALVDDAGGRFAIDAQTGEIRVADGSKIDFESATNHNVTVRVTDAGGLSYDEAFKLNVTNVNEAPTDLTMTGGAAKENSAGGTVVGNVAGADPDAGDTLTYQLTDDAHGLFQIDGHTGAITVAPGADLNFEQDAAHSVTVRVTDAGGKSFDETFEIKIDDVNEAVIAVDDHAAGREDHSITTQNVLANDFDLDGDTVTMTGFSQAAHGQVTYNGDGTFTYTPNKDFSGADSFTYTVTDGRGMSSQATVDLHVQGEADLPALGVHDVTLYAGNSAPLDITAALGDLDGSETLLIRIEHVPEGATLSAGTYQGHGVWTLSGDDLANLQISLPKDVGGDVELKVTVVATEADGDQVEIEQSLTMHVSGFQVEDDPEAPLPTHEVPGGELFSGATGGGERPTWPMLPALNAVDPEAAEHFFAALQNSKGGDGIGWDVVAPHTHEGQHAAPHHDAGHSDAVPAQPGWQRPSDSDGAHYQGHVATNAPQSWLGQVSDRFSWLWGMFWAYGGTRTTDPEQDTGANRQQQGR